MPTPFQSKAKFDPLTLDEMLKVPMAIKANADAEQEKYEKVADKYSEIKALAGDNKEAKQMLASYDAKMQQLVDRMTGYYGGDISAMSKQLRDMYRNEVVPVGIGLQAMKTYNDTIAKDPTAIGPKHTLKDFVNNPMLNNDWVSGAAMQTSIAKSMQTLVANARPQQIAKDKYNIYYYQGFSDSDILAGFNGNGPLAEVIKKQREIDGYDQMDEANQSRYNLMMMKILTDTKGVTSHEQNRDMQLHGQALSIQQAQRAMQLQEQAIENAMYGAKEVWSDGSIHIYMDGDKNFYRSDGENPMRYRIGGAHALLLGDKAMQNNIDQMEAAASSKPAEKSRPGGTFEPHTIMPQLVSDGKGGYTETTQGMTSISYRPSINKSIMLHEDGKAVKYKPAACFNRRGKAMEVTDMGSNLTVVGMTSLDANGQLLQEAVIDISKISNEKQRKALLNSRINFNDPNINYLICADEDGHIIVFCNQR